MKVYNTLTRAKEEFVPLEEGKVKMYVCGPTVYNYIHIGNARPFIIFDTLRRYLEYRGYDVTYVQNFTDVDDKIINRSHEEGISPEEVATKYIKEYFVDCDGLGIKRATVHPQVTDNIQQIIDFIKELEDKGYAYAVNGDVYFDTNKFEGYGKLSGQKQEDLEAGARIEVNDQKRHPMDFVLWKAKKEGEPGWESPWGEGRPGWHIECSVMSKRYLGETIDIHAGGQDLTFPHHENEIAQSEARSGKTFSKYWMHNGYININDEKMSKSKGNFFTVRDISKLYDLEIVRFFMLSAHYRNPVNFSDEMLNQAKAGLERLYNTKEKLEFTLSNLKESSLTEKEVELVKELDNFRQRFIDAMDDDVNTADAVSIIFELAKLINSNVDENSSLELAKKCLDEFNELTGVLNIVNKKKDTVLDKDIEELIQKRTDAKKNKEFQLADDIRQQLLDMGIVLEDTRQGVKWKRV
ncbi:MULTISPECIES: cysteine--tRNA ligase [unclassified Clostridioides]|uniref:cysteine--tRNA ligase n=1 Tax=unclassified Clostridioides TaxID=2635829 RepID=UPI001D0C08FB|nr:cysteine--tRNA ligase [Clostridioides sp. ZZV15-6388]MCC0638231.1 cysteine--tRNA ligase [Clostridioides sp. ES-S-0001-02]MCC0646300.1 cysteine--tRNA ligase [Clostridioides sp. ZZV14-6150]MCC0654503.1 cysteine--tRNA ligase [Clostridioides sp. ES-S-0001-03]MCC0658441.1 cysteine--tRNA ligase [Clostridioides sp. ES-S-0123-01]MCC0661790.1 cysteine--tRNA ligase [Clostridioides sp. ZZV14-6154]MCC0670337.1 cysteine--tRNA ligase [Clostridioides sp. ZZV14-6153]MCC0670622.1 cysteine--tRNA ligase [Cl